MTPCEQCRRTPATVELSFQARCAPKGKRLCDACARSAMLSGPFAVKPLPGPEKK